MPEPEKPFVNPMSGLRPAEDFHDPVAEARMKPTKEVLALLGLTPGAEETPAAEPVPVAELAEPAPAVEIGTPPAAKTDKAATP